MGSGGSFKQRQGRYRTHKLEEFTDKHPLWSVGRLLRYVYVPVPRGNMPFSGIQNKNFDLSLFYYAVFVESIGYYR